MILSESEKFQNKSKYLLKAPFTYINGVSRLQYDDQCESENEIYKPMEFLFMNS